MFQRKCSLLNALMAVGLTVLSGLIAQAQTSYSYRDLGTLGGTSSSAAAVNNAGQVVGASTLANGEQHGFYWSPGTGMIDIFILGGTASTSQASGINNLGDIVGSITNSSVTLWHAFLWNSTTGIRTDLNSLLSPADASIWVLSFAKFVNDNRQVIGYGSATIGGTYYAQRSYMLDLRTNTFTDLGVTGATAWAHAVNASSQVIGSISGVAYLYSGGSLTSLAPLYGGKSINNAGASVGYLQNSDAAYYSPTGVVTDLGHLGTGIASASANSINNAASPVLVGDSLVLIKNSNIHHAFRWIAGSGAIQDLNNLTPNLGKKILLGATCVSDTGYIACQQDPSGINGTANTRAYLLTPQ